MNSKFLAGLVATLVSIVVVVGLALFLSLVIEVSASKNWFTISAAFLTIGTWTGIYRWLKPTPPPPTTLDGELIEPIVQQIDDSQFKAAYLKQANLTKRVGIFLAITCLPGAICVLLFSGDLTVATSMIGLILLLLFGGIGALILVKSIKLYSSIKSGDDRLMQAIESNALDYVIWFFGHVTSQPGTALKEVKTYRVLVYTVDAKKPINLGAQNKDSYNEILAFLKSKFPNAESKSDPLIKDEMKAKYEFKV